MEKVERAGGRRDGPRGGRLLQQRRAGVRVGAVAGGQAPFPRSPVLLKESVEASLSWGATAAAAGRVGSGRAWGGHRGKEKARTGHVELTA